MSSTVVYTMKYTDTDRLARCIRSILVIGNLFFCILSCAIIAVGIYLIVEQIFYVEWVYGTQLAAASCYLILTAGSIMFIISFIGCFGTLFENKRLLLIYGFVLAVIFMLSIAGASIAIVLLVWFEFMTEANRISSFVKVYMTESLLSDYGTETEYDQDSLITRSWDMIQEKLECCSVDDGRWGLYKETFWYKSLPGLVGYTKPYVPASCCKRVDGEYLDLFLCQMGLEGGPPASNYGGINPALNMKGCYNAGKAALYPILGYFIGIGFSLALLVSIGMVCSQLYYMRL